MKKHFFWFLLGVGTLLEMNCQIPADSARLLYSEYQEAWAGGDMARSGSLLERIIDEGDKLPDYNLALIRNSLGFVYYEMGNIEGALEQYRIADSLTYARDPGTVKLKINVYNNLSLLYDWLGEYSHALSYYDRALNLLQFLPVRDEAYYNKFSMLKFNKGFVYYRLGRFMEALELLKDSERIKEALDQAYLGSVYYNLARIYLALDSLEMADRYFSKSLDQWIEESGEDHYQLANVYLHFGLFLAQQGDREQASAYMALAIQNYKSNYGIRHPLTASAYEGLANFFLEEGDFSRALEIIQLALISVSDGFSDPDPYTNPETRQSLHALSLLKCLDTKTRVLEGMAGKAAPDSAKIEILDAALATNARAIEVLYLIQDSYLSGESRTFLISGQRDLFSTGIRLNLMQFALVHDTKLKEQAFILAATGKSNELVFEMRENEWLYLKSLSDTLATSVLELKQQIDLFSNLIQIETQEMIPDTSRVSAWQDHLFRSMQDFGRKMEQLKKEHPQIGQFELSDKDFSLGWARRHLGKRETLVEYYISGKEAEGPQRLYAFVVSRKDFHIYQGTLDSSFYINLENVMRNLHGFNFFTESLEQFETLKTSLFGIYQQIFEPVEQSIQGRKLIIAPDAELATLPFDALISQNQKDTILNYTGLPYLLNAYNIIYVYNSRTMNRARKIKTSFPKVHAYVPNYAHTRPDSSLFLRGALSEVREIVRMVKGSRIEDVLSKDELREYMNDEVVIHLAMHAHADDQGGSPPYFLLDADHDSVYSDRLYDYEINSMVLTSPMVVLSSCETGGGLLQEGEGIFSLSRSFLLAGAASVIHTLWPVEDVKAGPIMTGFYRELKTGKSKGLSLSTAKKKYLANSSPSYTHPYYWAGYQVTGNPDPLIMNRKPVFYSLVILAICGMGFYLIRRSFLPRT